MKTLKKTLPDAKNISLHIIETCKYEHQNSLEERRQAPSCGGSMNSASFGIFISNIDQERFGIKTARAVDLTTANLPFVLDFCISHDVKLLIARCSISDLDTAQSMEKQGFLLMDTLVYYTFDLVQRPVSCAVCNVNFRPIRAGEAPSIERVAVESFRSYFGHYHADKKLDKKKCDEVYVDWAKKACQANGADENFLVADIQDRIVAFGVFRLNSVDEGELFLGGIHPEYQGQGIYQSFLHRAVEWCLLKNAKRMIISTQLNNVAVQKVLTKFGFEITRGCYTFHKWFD